MGRPVPTGGSYMWVDEQDGGSLVLSVLAEF